jgi:hypothetical protein
MKKKIYIGWDSREGQAYDVAVHSFKARSAEPKSIQTIPLELQYLPMLKRPIEQRDGRMWDPISGAPMATEFAISRFCVPFLQKKGWALFCDCDVLCMADVQELFDLARPQYAVMVVKHDLKPVADSQKMDGQVQTSYARKLWSSVVLWNCGHEAHQALTVKELNEWPGRDLHAFKWLPDEVIGELPPEWNVLVGMQPIPAKPRLLHFTLGTPNIAGYEKCDYATAWFEEQNKFR